MADETDFGTAYGAQSDDINEKLVLDLAWERQQKKVRESVGHCRLSISCWLVA